MNKLQMLYGMVMLVLLVLVLLELIDISNLQYRTLEFNVECFGVGWPE